MSDLIAAVDRHIEDHLEQSLQDLIRLCRQPSVSAQHYGIDECAALTREILREHGFAAQVQPSSGHPIVTGRIDGAGPRTMLFYNHYDVQPAEPLELWTTPPWEPAVRDGKMYARGVSDDKGHIVCRLMALDALRAVSGTLPCAVKFLIEGEEESGSNSLESFVEAHADELAADGCLWEFGGVDHTERPVITLGMRGMCYVQFSVRTANYDAHSGLGGSILPNAAWRLTWALASLKGPDERIRIPGFYDDVRPAGDTDMALLAQVPPVDEHLKQAYGVAAFLRGAAGVELLRQQVFEPTCTICGLDAGYQGPGTKTVQPAEAYAKVDMRMVPDQDPHKIYAALRAYLDAQGFADVHTALLCTEHPARIDPQDPFARMVIESAEETYGRPAVVEPLSGGTGPLYPFVKYLGVPVATAGCGYPGGRAHAPDENLRLADLVLGAKHTARVMLHMGKMPG